MTNEKLIDQDMGPIATGAAERALASGEPGEISMALLRLALHGPDWELAERSAREHATHPDVWVRRNAATALGHIARVHGALDLDLSLPVLTALLDDAEVAEWAEAAVEDVETYMGVPRARVFAPARASALSRVAYDEGSRILEVEFRNGGVYEYLNIPADEFARLRSAESMGRYLSQRIRPRYHARKLRKPRASDAD